MASNERSDRSAAGLTREELVREYHMFLNLMNNLPLSVYFKNKEGRLVKISKFKEQSQPGEMVGKTDFDLYPEEAARRYTEDDKRVMETKEPILNKEERSILANGVDHYFLTSKAPLLDDEGNVMGILGITTEITDRKKAEKERLEAEKEIASKRVAAEAVAKIAATTSEIAQRYKGMIDELRQAQEKLVKESNMLQNLLDNTPAFIYFKDRDGRYVRVSNSYQAIQPEDMVGKTDFDLYPEDQARGAAEDDKRVMETGEPIIDKEERFITSDGSELRLSTTKAPLSDREGNVIGVVGVARNISK
jgi:PAS domain S-box-containing protein